MSMVKPIALNKNAFDSTNSEVFYFNVNGGNQVVKNKITIRNNSTNVTVYTNTVESYQFQQTIPSNTLTNGTYYNYYFNTYDINNNESENSNVIGFYCYSKPILTFTNLVDGQTIENASYIFNFQYNQIEGELLDFIKINLYSSSNQLINSSQNLYSTSNPPISFFHEFSGMENNTTYKVQVQGVTINGTILTSDLISFNVIYNSPILYSNSNLLLENKCNDGYVQINSNIITIDGKSNVSQLNYIDNSMVDIRFPNDYILWDKGYNIQKDFILSIWMKPTWIYKFCEMFNSTMANGYKINFVREIPYGESVVKDYFELNGYLNGILTVYQRSNYIDIMNTNDKILVWIKKIGTTYTLTLQVVTSGTTSSIDWGVGNSNVDYNTLTDLNWNGETYTQGTEPTLLNGNMDSIFPITSFKLYCGIYDNLDITKDTTKSISTSFPIWDYNTELNCDFDDNINGGNINIVLSQVSEIKLKKREYGSFDWMTIYSKDVSSESDFNISLQDSYVKSGKKFQWAIVPILAVGVEGDYIIEEIDVILNGTFISNKNGIFKLYSGVTYGGGTQNIRIGQLQPIGLKYPIIIQNGKVNYFSNNLSGLLYGYNFETTRIVDRNSVVKQTNDLLEFLSNGDSICITDWNGNIWIAKVSDSPNVSYNESYGNGIANIGFSFVEQGKYDNEEDMINNGML